MYRTFSGLAKRYTYSIYFMKGTDPRLLNHQQQHQVEEIISKYDGPSSFLIFNPQQVQHKISSWLMHLPWIRPYYAIKSNPIDVLLSKLSQNGAGFDCASKTEIMTAFKHGMRDKDIVYSNTMKQPSDLRWASQNGITLTTADTIGQLQKIKQIAPVMKILWRVSITEESTDKLATPFSVKFGDDISSVADIHSRMKQIQNMGIKLQGIHFHCGSGQHGSSAFKKAILLARQCMKVGRQYRHNMETLDIGGGFPSGHLNQSTIEALTVTKNDPLGYRVIAQPGRHFSAYSCYLVTKVLGKRNKNGKKCYHINDSVYHAFNCTIMDGVSFENSDQFYSKINQSGKIQQIGEMQNSSLFGMTCCGGDIIVNNIEMPTELNTNDYLCLSGMGAYTYGPRSTYNGMNSLSQIITWETKINSYDQTISKERV